MLSAAKVQRPRNYLSCCSWIFHLIYALSTPTTMLLQIFPYISLSHSTLSSLFLLFLYLLKCLPTYLFQPTDLSLPSYFHLLTYLYLPISTYLLISGYLCLSTYDYLPISNYVPMSTYLDQHNYYRLPTYLHQHT